MNLTTSMFRPEHLQNGDLIFWRGDVPGKVMSYLNLVRFATLSDFGHVSIAWPNADGPCHVEATTPKIHYVTLPQDAEVFVTPLRLGLDNATMANYFADKIGKRYSVLDAVRGYLGLTSAEPDRWQCAELAEDFLNTHGVSMRGGTTPSRLLQRVMHELGAPLYRLVY